MPCIIVEFKHRKAVKAGGHVFDRYSIIGVIEANKIIEQKPLEIFTGAVRVLNRV